ncbi:LOW QUALITY PROTEIN: uncharacterized protein [Palaemon carinicauda]|uniref:LOW QUALITY PROTEIN: uncharacterized protein n=1 Tax=Palaemon carinicauda TaxID=392227 RepID=UPI0035B5C467
MKTPNDSYLILLGLLFVSFSGVEGLPKDSITTVDSYIWTEEVSLAPLSDPMPDELPLCDIAEGQNGCLLQSPEPMTWTDAHKYCRNRDAFLPSRNQSQYLGKQWPNKWAGNLTWTALTSFLGHYQWLGRSPFDTPARADFIKWKDPPTNWSTECAAFHIASGDFQLEDCLRELEFFCVLNSRESSSDKTIDFSDMELKVEVRTAHPIEETYSWIKVSKDAFNDLVLTCQAFSRSTGERLSHQPRIFWRKDNVYIDHSASGLQPSTVHDSSKSESVVPGITEQAIQMQLAQGTYWCETWIPKSEERLTSNKMLITLEDWVTIILRANRYEPINRTHEEMQAELCTIFKDKFPSLDEYIWDVISTEREADDNSSLWLTKYKFHVHMPRSDMNLFYFENRNVSSVFRDIFKKADFLDTSNLTFATFCYKQKESFKSGKSLVWPFTEAGKVYPRNLKCKVDYGRLLPGVCKGDYNNGAYLDFDPSACQWLDRCPVGYKNVGKTHCIALSQSQSWEEAFKENYKTGQETTILDIVGLPLFSRMFNDIKKYTNRTSNQSKLWLPVKRVGHLGPLIFQGSGSPQWKIQNYNEFENYNISWLEQNPHSDQDCLSIDLETKKLQTSDCQEKMPFLAVIDLQDTPKPGQSLEKPSPQCTEQDSGSCLCPPGWRTPVFKGENEICFKLFSPKKNFTWEKANEFCSAKGAQLPTPNVGFLDWVYRQHLNDTNVSSVWMDIKWVPDRIVYSGTEDNINWLPETNYRNKYGVLRQDGWILESSEAVKEDVLCQQIIRQNVSVELRVNEPSNQDSQTMCIDINPVQLLMSKEKESIQCFVNGIGLNPEQTKDSGCQYELKVNRQGYYQCQTWTRPPYMLVKSNVILHRDFSTYTYVVTLRNGEAYRPENYDATFQSRRQARTSKQCSDIVRRDLETSDLNGFFRFSNTLSFYTPNSNFTQVLHSFHLECELKETKMNEKKLLEALRDRLIKSEVLKESGCYFEEIRSTVGCLASVTVDDMAMVPRNLTWPETIGNEIVVSDELCITPEGDPATRECLGNFIEGYYWQEPSHSCSGDPSNVTRSLWEINRGAVDSTVGAALVNLTANKSSLLPVDIYLIAKTFQNLSESKDSIYHFDDIVTVVSNIMGANATAFEVIQRKLNSSSTLLEAFEELTFKVQLPEADGDQITKSSGDNVAVDRLDLEANSTIIGLKSMGNSEEYLHMGFKKEDLVNAEVAIIFPNNLTYTVSTKTSQKPKSTDFEGKNEKVSLVFAIYQNEKFFQDVSHENYTVNSHIIMASYKGEVIKDLVEPVKILFKPLKAGNDTKCVYWDFMLNNKRGGWSEKGCVKGERQGQHDVCLCNHLTSFAQLINYDEDSGFDGSHAMVLDIITIIGCCLSIIGLLLIFTTFCLFKKWRRSLSNKILVNLSFSVFCSMVIFLAGIDQSWNDPLCRSVAVGLHYFILASFGWMLVEAVHQYLKFVKVVGTYIPRFLWKASVCAWGIPVLPVLSVLIYDHSLYDSSNDYNSATRICWMSVQGFKYAFLPPLALTMTVNVIMYSLIIHGAICGRARVNSTMSERTLFMNQLRMAVCVFFLLGFTWIFGLLAVSHLRQVFSYLFCIFNTLQGVFLFLCHICREQGARKYWKDFLSVLTKDPVSSTPGNSFNHINSPFLRGHPDSVSFDKCGGILVLPQGPPLRHHLRRGRGSLLSAQTNSTLLQSRISFSP